MRERVWIHYAIYGFLLAVTLTDALKPGRSKFKIATSSTTTTTTTTEEPKEEADSDAEEEDSDIVTTTGHTLTGIPQIDYIWDPNLPRELNGYNLSSYPFYSTVPPDIDFKCNGLHDGFYASIPHKCQVYHHCLYGTRYDFLCANFTAFDQKTFICHFVSEVDCVNSKKYWHRNDALYQATTTTTTSTTTTTTTTTPAPITAAPLPPQRPGTRDRDFNRRRRPFRRRPAYDYYDEAYYDDEYDRTRPRGYDRRDSYDYDDRPYRRDRERDRDRDRDYRDPERDRNIRNRDRDDTYRSRDAHEDRDRDRDPMSRDKFAPRANRRDPARGRPAVDDDELADGEALGRPYLRDRTRDTDLPISDDRRKDPTDSRSRDPVRDDDYDRRYSDARYRPNRPEYDEKEAAEPSPSSSTEGLVVPAAPGSSVYARPRVPPKIRRPVPVFEQDKYAYNATAAAPATAEASRPRPGPMDYDYPADVDEEDNLEAVRPRRPMRRRPTYRTKETLDAREPTRERERSYVRNRQRDEIEDADEEPLTEVRDKNDEVPAGRSRKRTDRPRSTIYDRGDRIGYDRDRQSERDPEPSSGRSRYPYRAERPMVTGQRPSVRDEPILDQPRSAAREREPASLRSEAPTRANFYRAQSDGASVPSEDPVGSAKPIQSVGSAEPFRSYDRTNARANSSASVATADDEVYDEDEPRSPDDAPPADLGTNSERVPVTRGSQKYQEESPANDWSTASSAEYYDESEERTPASSTARATPVRIVKRPFLPSRGGNPNPRGLKPLGSRTGIAKSDAERPKTSPRTAIPDRSAYRESRTEDSDTRISADGIEATQGIPDRYDSYESDRRKPYDAYRSLKLEPLQSRRNNERADNSGERDSLSRENERRETPAIKGNDYSGYKSYPGSSDGDSFLARPNLDAGASIGSVGSIGQDIPRNPDSSADKSRHNANDLAYSLQDIPESEYDVTLNDALTPSLNNDPGIPSGFVLPIHRNLARDASHQSSEHSSFQLSPPESFLRRHQSAQSQPIPRASVPVTTSDRLRTLPHVRPEENVYSAENSRASWHGVPQL